MHILSPAGVSLSGRPPLPYISQVGGWYIQRGGNNIGIINQEHDKTTTLELENAQMKKKQKAIGAGGPKAKKIKNGENGEPTVVVPPEQKPLAAGVKNRLEKAVSRLAKSVETIEGLMEKANSEVLKDFIPPYVFKKSTEALADGAMRKVRAEVLLEENKGETKTFFDDFKETSNKLTSFTKTLEQYIAAAQEEAGVDESESDEDAEQGDAESAKTVEHPKKK